MAHVGGRAEGQVVSGVCHPEVLVASRNSALLPPARLVLPAADLKSETRMQVTVRMACS